MEAYDEVLMHGSSMVELAEAGLVMELESPLRRRGDTSLDQNQMVDPSRYMGKIYGVPLTATQDGHINGDSPYSMAVASQYSVAGFPQSQRYCGGSLRAKMGSSDVPQEPDTDR